MANEELDHETLRGCVRGDAAAMGVLYDTYRQRVFYLARRMVGEREAEDLCQEIFIAVFRSLPGFRRKSKLSTWIMAVGTRICLMHLRKRRPQAETLESAEEELADTLSPAHEVAKRDFWQRISSAIDSLPASQRAALTLRSFEDMSYEEIARAMELDPERVRATLFRARRSLIERLKEKG